MRLSFFALVALASLSACGDAAPPLDSGTDAPSADAGPPDSGLPPPVCTRGTHWTPGTTAFTEATHDWQLDTIGALGQRIDTADIDGDGFADLAVRVVGTAHDVVAPGSPVSRAHWLLRNRGDGTFADVTESSGILTPRQMQAAGVLRPGEVWAFGDVDNDGDVDAYTGLNTQDPATSLGESSEIMLNDGHGHFTLGPVDDDARVATGMDSVAGASFLDYDRDGILDLWVTENGDSSGGGQSQLYHGVGDGHFTRVTNDIGVRTQPWVSLTDLDQGLAHARSWAAAACDLEGDGTPDVMTPSYGRAPNLLFVGHRAGDGTVTYENVSVASGYAFDGNMTYTDNQFFLCYCQSTPAAPECMGVTASPMVSCTPPLNWSSATDMHPFRLGGNSGTTTCADIDGDGDLDLLTSEIEHWWAGTGSDAAEWLLNDGTTPLHFTRPGRAAMGIVVPHDTPGGWDEGIMTNAVFDFDLDARPDFYFGASDYPGNHGLLYHQDSPGHFETVPITDGIDHHRSHGIAIADFDRDGDLDVVVGHSSARCTPTGYDDCYPTTQVRFFRNVMPAGNWVQLHLVGGAGTNAMAIGARVTVMAGGTQQTQEVEGGHGHYGIQNDAVLTFGLGADCMASITVRWPDATLTTETFSLGAGHRYRLTQGMPVVAER